MRKILSMFIIVAVSVAVIFSPFQLLMTNHFVSTAYAYEDDKGGDEEKDGGDDLLDEDGDGIPDELKDWDPPYEPSKELDEAHDTAVKSGTCFEAMNSVIDLLFDESSYYAAVAQPGSEGKTVIDEVLEHILELQVAIGKNRLVLENKSGDAQYCEDNEKLAYLNEPLESLKGKMRYAGWLIDTKDSRELTDKIIDRRCGVATTKMNELGVNIDRLQDKLADRVEEGDLKDVSNAKELLNIARTSYGNASQALTDASDLKNLEKKMRACTAARDEAALGNSVFYKAKKFNNGKKEDKSDPVEEIDARIKMFLSALAEQRLEVMMHDDDIKQQVLDLLAEAEAEIVTVQIDFAQVKYDKSPKIKEFLEKIDTIIEKFKTSMDLLKESEVNKISKQARKVSARKLIKKARKQISTVRKELKKKAKKADTKAEQEIIQFVEQTSVIDAAAARKAAKAYKGSKKYKNAQLQAFEAIHTARAAKEVLKEVQ